MKKLIAVGAMALSLYAGNAVACGAKQVTICTRQNSVYLSGTNQYNNPASGCWNTPYLCQTVANWWWASGSNLRINTYAATSCGGSPNCGFTATVPGFPNIACTFQVNIC